MVLLICSQLAGKFGLIGVRGDSCSSVEAAAVATRDSNLESPTCIGGGLGIRDGWSPELGGLFGLEGPRRFMGGRAGDEGDVSRKGR